MRGRHRTTSTIAPALSAPMMAGAVGIATIATAPSAGAATTLPAATSNPAGAHPSAFPAAVSVTQNQWNLAAIGYLRYDQLTGKADAATVAATRAFATDQCLDPDGQLTAPTTGRLTAVIASVQKGAGMATRTGAAGPATKAAITAYQRKHRISPVDGRAGATTYAVMGFKRTLPCGPIVGDIRKDSSRILCATGTVDLGVWPAWTNGTAIKARLCAIPGLTSTSAESHAGNAYSIPGAKGRAIVNARSSRATLAMVQAAKKSGLTLAAYSSFRTMAHQQAICRANSLCRKGNYLYVYKPGTSHHQLGAAIDFSGPSAKGGRSCTTSRAVQPSSKVWSWLKANGGRYGFKQYSAEAWHWETVTSSTSC